MPFDHRYELNRLAALRAYDILDTAPEDCFDRLVCLATLVAGTPMAALTFVDAARAWRKAAVGLDAGEVVRPDATCGRVVAGGCDVVSIDPCGQDGWRLYAGAPVATSDGFVLGVLAVMDDVPRELTAAQLDGLRTLAAAAMAQLESRRSRRAVAGPQDDRFRQLADALPYIVWTATPDGTVDFANQSVVDYAGLADVRCISEQWIGLLHPDDVECTLATWAEAVRTGSVFSCEYRLRRAADNVYRWHLAKGMPIRDGEGRITKWYGTTTDIHDMKVAHEAIDSLAFYDTLTGLPNRRLLMDRLAHAVAEHARLGRVGAVLLLDLDNFKSINDTLGHDNGDLLLDLVAERLLASVAASDVVARLGGDEFVVVLEDLGMDEEAAAQRAGDVARRILAALGSPFDLDGYERHVTPSIGVALFGAEAPAVSEVLKHADLAMYQAKAAGRNTFCFFEAATGTAAVARVRLEAELRQGLARGEFLLHYQPQLGADGTVAGVEALLRWQNPQRGMVFPAEFIPVAEQTGLILPLGQWVMEEACRQLGRLGAGAATRHLHVSVNVSAHQFRQPGFVADALAALSGAGADPGRLTIELTESVLVEDIDGVIAKMETLKRHGVRFALDDFGTGYSSLTCLKRLPLDQLNIDRSFVANVLHDTRDYAIVNGIAVLGRSLGIDVIAEGVETPAQRDLLLDCGCTALQGYLFGRPVPAAQLDGSPGG
ncbi:PAS domain S-box-containing protein/diguanylate cyclase (GGDEF) domain-containing protein [Massilia sp. PDC64]|nr:GGDEF domain-containing phosphodiesterase [Massilia sp. PDC64]SDE79902.1 PAS domain S-box-containing protein/diguanylate cyclase (GGDEF) domain-containing protein [Massilia sp. PDC64]